MMDWLLGWEVTLRGFTALWFFFCVIVLMVHMVYSLVSFVVYGVLHVQEKRKKGR